jgi:putative transposase
MAKKEYSLAHTKWMCKYHIVFTPKYRRKIIYNQYKADIRDIIKQLCSYKGVEIIEGHLMPDHVHILLSVQNRKENSNEISLPVNAIIPQVVSGLKRLIGREIGFNIWQRSYYDHVIRGDEDYWNIRQYIEENPLRWVEI